MDNNGADGGIQKSEFVEYLTQHVGCHPGDTDKMFRELDINGDGVISKFEFMRGFEKFRTDVLKARERQVEHQRTINRMMQAIASNLNNGKEGLDRAPRASAFPSPSA